MARGRTKKPEVLAAGGVVWRRAVIAEPGGSTDVTFEVVLIHRPRQDDWSFPKGKLDRGESFEEAARREVEEETGLVCDLGVELPPAHYLDGKGRSKIVRYWVMRVTGVTDWGPNREVDRRRWVTVDDAAGMLTYEHDRVLLDEVADTLRRRSEAS